MKSLQSDIQYLISHLVLKEALTFIFMGLYNLNSRVNWGFRVKKVNKENPLTESLLCFPNIDSEMYFNWEISIIWDHGKTGQRLFNWRLWPECEIYCDKFIFGWYDVVLDSRPFFSLLWEIILTAYLDLLFYLHK